MSINGQLVKRPMREHRWPSSSLARADGHRCSVTPPTSHIGRTVTVADLTGTLTGLIPVGDTYQLALIVGSSRVWTAALPADTHIEIHQKGQPT